MRSTDPALLAIEVQPRDPRPPVGPLAGRQSPEPDGLISSWLHRLAFGNGVPPKAFGPVLDLGSGAWSSRLDLALPAIVQDRLVRCTGLTPGAVGGMTLAGVGARALLLPLRADLSPGRRGRRQSAWLQFCPQCLAEDGHVFPEAMAPGDDGRLPRATGAASDRCPACGHGTGAVQPGVALRP